MENKNNKLVLIDGNSLVNRAFYALPLLSNSDGEFSNAVYGFCNILVRLIEKEKPKYMAVAFDMGHPTFRHELFADYKGKRNKMPDELASQLPILKAVLKAMNICFIEKKGIEADDIIGSLSKKFDINSVVVSGDRDLFQLVDKNTQVWFTKKGITEIMEVTPNNIKEVYGVNANQVVELKALMGDSSDNIKGVAGVGEKTAKDLIETYENINNIYNNIDKISGKLHEKLVNGKEDAYLSKTLATINTGVELEQTLEDLTYDFPFDENVLKLFKKYEFKTLLKKQEMFNAVQEATTKSVKITNVLTDEDFANMLSSLNQTKEMAFHILNDELHIANSKFEEYFVKIKTNLIDNGFNFEYVLTKLKGIMEDETYKKVLLNSKNTMRNLIVYGVQLKGVEFDCNLAKYLLSGSKKTDYDAPTFAAEYGYDEKNICACMLSVKDEILSNLKNEGMVELYFNIELPLVEVLFDMEQNGFKVDVKALDSLSEEYNNELQILSEKIYEDAGEKFNIQSPKQLSAILFDKLNLKLAGNKKKSTNVDVLDQLVLAHPIIDKILRYRKIQKLDGTYIEPFKKMVENKSHLIHTVFNQTLTATGRLSSSEPNLQNIPVRDEEGKLLRKIFIPREDGGKIITSDYSQIELRLLAHFSKDKKLIYAYNNELDIHSQTASDIFNVPINAVTPEMRRDAKTVNFGIIYGISDYGLSKNLYTSRKNAKEVIDRYFDNYSQVKNYMNQSVERAKEQGFVTTLLGRKRKIDEISSSNFNTRTFGERAAMNMPLQGTASDIIKLAMIKVYNALKENNLKSKLILQIHDELIVDCAKGEEEAVKKILKENMENAIKLSVPLTVDIGVGKNWFEAK